MIQLNPCAKQMARRAELGKASLLTDSQAASNGKITWHMYIKCMMAERKTQKVLKGH